MSGESRTDTAVDEALVERARAGDAVAMRAIYDAHVQGVAQRLRRLLGDGADVEDAVQLTFEAVFRNLHRYEPGRLLRPWLGGFAVRIAQNILRSRRRRRWLSFGLVREPAEDVESGATDEKIARRQLVRHVYRVLDELSEKRRLAFVLHDVEGLSLTEIGQLVGTSPQAIRERLLSARARVVEELERRGLLAPSELEAAMSGGTS